MGTRDVSRTVRRLIPCIGLALLLGALPTEVVAQEEDNSGTNPIAFTWDFRFYYEGISSPGDVSSETFTFEHQNTQQVRVQHRPDRRRAGHHIRVR
jgi:hypothetical protein